jgi:flagellar biosynthesis protein FliR
MKVSLPVYVVGLVVTFVYGIVKYYVPTLPLDEAGVQWIILGILSALSVDVTQGLKARSLL